MTIASEITRINGNIADAYTAASGKGATMPVTQNSANLATCIGTITGSSPVITSLSVTPTTSAQTITAPSGTDGYSPVNVAAVTSSIDTNITAGNIKDGVTILGVTGNYTGGGSSSIGIPREVSAQGVYQIPTTSLTFSLPNDATDVGNYCLYYAFYNCTGLTSIDLSSLTTVSGSSCLYYAFYNCTGLTSIDLSSLTTVSGSSCFDYAFNGCTGLTSVDLSSLTTVSGSNCFDYAFNGCTGLTSIDLSSLTTVSGSNCFDYAFNDCTGLTSVDLSSLTTVSGSSCFSNAFRKCTGLTNIDLSSLTTVSGSSCFSNAFRNCTGLTDIYFRALTTSSFGTNTNQFTNLMQQTGTSVMHTIHFPSNMQAKIQTLSGYPLFGGTSGYVTLAFDLPATS